MSSKTKSKCRFAGCPNRPLKDRMFCEEHLADYEVPDVAAHHRKKADGFGRKKKKKKMMRKKKR